MRCFSPAERSMACNQDGRNGKRIQMLEAAGNGNASVEDVIAADFFRGQLSSHGDGAVKIIRMGSSIGGDFKAGLGPSSALFRMGVDDAPNSGEFFVKQKVSRQVRGRAETALDNLPLQVSDHHVGGL